MSPRLGATSRKMPDPAVLQAGNAEVLIGRLAEYGELLDVLAERPGLTVISADPWSGTSDLLAAVIEELDGAHLRIDARACAGSLDLAMAIADTTVVRLAPDAAAWWTGTAPPASAAGLGLSRTLSQGGVDLHDLRRGSGSGERRLTEAIELLVVLAEGDAVLAVDHLGLMLSALSAQEARQLLGELRAAGQGHPGLDLVVVEHPDGPVRSALADSGHPLYRAGQLLRLRRPRPARFVEDLAITRPEANARIELIAAAAELAGGVPALTWRVIELAPPDGEDDQTRALAGWMRLRSCVRAPLPTPMARWG